MLERALIVGAGDGISASFARALHRDGTKVALAARTHMDGYLERGLHLAISPSDRIQQGC